MEDGLINKDTLIIEATSGNTGIGLCGVCAYYKLKCVIVMPENASIERVKIMRAYNADVRLTEIGRQIGLVKDERYNKFFQNPMVASRYVLLTTPLRGYPSQPRLGPSRSCGHGRPQSLKLSDFATIIQFFR